MKMIDVHERNSSLIKHHINFETFSQATGCFLHCVTEASVQQAQTEKVVLPEHKESY